MCILSNFSHLVFLSSTYTYKKAPTSLEVSAYALFLLTIFAFYKAFIANITLTFYLEVYRDLYFLLLTLVQLLY